MTTDLRLTDAGKAAILDPANVGTQAVRIASLALGAGSGPGGAGDDARTTLRDQRDIEDVVGSNSLAGQIAVVAEYTTATAYAVTELGLFAQIDADPAFLLAYWTDAGTAFINKVADLRTFVAATLAVVRSEADIAVTVAPNITVGVVGSFDDLSDTPASKVNAARHKVVVRADGAGLEYVAGLAAHEVATDVESRAGLLRTKAVPPAGLKAVISDLINGAPINRNTLNKLSDAINAAVGMIPGPSDIDARIALSRSGIAGPRSGKSATYAVVAGDDGKTIEVNANAAARTVNLPDLAAADNGFTVTVIKTDSSANAVTVDGNAADTINGAATYVLKTRWESVILKWTGSVWIAIGGASTSWLRDFFGDAGSREWTAAGVYNYQWEWDTPNGLVILIGGQGGGGGGGGGGGSGNKGGYAAGGNRAGAGHPGGNGAPGATNSTGGGGGGGQQGGDGGETRLVVSGVTHRAPGGDGGTGGGGGRGYLGLSPEFPGYGGGGGNKLGPGGNARLGRYRNAGLYPRALPGTGLGDGQGSDGGAGGGVGGHRGFQGTPINMIRQAIAGGGGDIGAEGKVLVVNLRAMSLSTAMTLTVGAGSPGGAGGTRAAAGSFNADGGPGPDGGPGRVILIPLF